MQILADNVSILFYVLGIVGSLYVIKDRRAKVYKEERDQSDAALREALQREQTLTVEAERLRQERSNEPVLMLLSSVMEQVTICARNQQATTDKLESLNGALQHVEAGLRDVTECLRGIVGLAEK